MLQFPARRLVNTSESTPLFNFSQGISTGVGTDATEVSSSQQNSFKS